MKNPRPLPEMREGPEAFDHFKQAVKAVLTVPKSAMPPSPFGKSERRKAGAKVRGRRKT
jgi:hypothetical protein